MVSEPETPPVQVAKVETVNVGTEPALHPAFMWIVACVTFSVLGGFAIVTYLVLTGEAGRGIDAATKGSVIQTWNNLAVAAAAVWTGAKFVERALHRPNS